MTVQAVEEFYIIRKTGKRREWCRTCVKAYVTQWQRENPDKVAIKFRRSVLKRKYGLTPQDYAAMLERQNGQCAICQAEPSPNLGLSVDHCHATGVVRGLLCAACNRALGQFQDDLERLRRALDYLQGQ
jgi:hypothetical protein